MTIDRLTADDRMMLSASEAWPQDIVALAILDGSALLDADGRLRIESVRELIRRRLHLVPRFRQVIRTPRRGLGPAFWADAADFDVADHVLERRLEAGASEGTLLRVTEEVRRAPMDLSRPLWQMCFVTGLPAGRVGWIVKTHHAMADGLAAIGAIRTFLDPERTDAGPQARPWTPSPARRDWELLADNVAQRARDVLHAISSLFPPRRVVGQLRAAWPAMRELVAETPSPVTSLGALIGVERKLALIRADWLVVRRVARVHGASVNDVLLAVLAGGIRSLLLSRAEPVEGVAVRVYVPVTLRRRLRGAHDGNRISQMVVPLPLGGADPVGRLRQIGAETAVRKGRMRSPLGTFFGGRIIRGLLLKIVIRQRVHITTASLPGPRQPMFLAGARVLDVFPILPLIGNVPLGIGAISYAGAWEIGIAADRDAYPDLAVLVAGMRAELEALADSVGRDPHETRDPVGDQEEPQSQPVAAR